MKDIRRAWGIPALVCVLAGAATAGPASSGQARKLRNDVVAVVLTGTGARWTEVSVSYPGAVSGSRALQDLAELGRTGGWSFGTPKMTRGVRDTQAAAQVMRSGSSERFVWVAVWALRRYSRVTFAAVSPRAPTASGQLENRFVSAVWSGGGGLWSCDVTVKDRGFRSVAELTAEPSAPAQPAAPAATVAPQPQTPAPRGGTDWRMVLVGVVAVLAGAIAYLLAARSVRRAPASHP